MAQADGVVANGTGSAVRSDINTQYAALWSNHSGSTEPSSGKVAYQFWADTNTSILKIRNSANNAWINLFTLAGGIDVDAASNFNEDVTFTGASYNLVWDKSDNALEFADNAKAAFGTSSDLTIYHDGSNSYVSQVTAGQNLFLKGDAVQIRSASNEQIIETAANGAVSLYYDNSKKFETKSWGAYLYGDLCFTDNNKVVLGTGDDLQIYHNGSDSIIHNATGNLTLRGSYIQLNNAANTEAMLSAAENGAVSIYYDNSKKLSATSEGIKVEGGSDVTLHLTSSTSGSASIEFGDTDDDDEAQIWYDNYSKAFNFRTSEASDLVFYRDGTERTRITSTGTETAGYNKSFLVKSDSAYQSNSSHILQSNENNQVATIIEHSGDTNPYGLIISFSDDDPDNNTNYFLKCDDSSNTNRLFIYSDGDVHNHDNSYTSSDATLKENIVDATSKLEDLKKLKVRNFNWKADHFPQKSKKKQLGFIAQEVEEVFPALVSEHDIAAGTPGDGHVPLIKKAIKQAWDPIIIKAMQELIAKVETLETKVAALEG